MIPILHREGTEEFNTNGIGRLSDAVECIVTEERNGIYELQLKYPVAGIHYDDLAEGNIICATHDDTGDMQPFDIYRIVRSMDGMITVNARHISYRLTQLTAIPFSAGSCAATLAQLQLSVLPECPFTFWTDKEVASQFTLSVPTSARSVLGGIQGSVLDVYGKGEYEWDKWTVKLHLNRGSRSGVTIRYGKNLTDLQQQMDEGGVYSGVVPFWNGENGTLLMLPERVLYRESNETPGQQAEAEGRAKVVPLDLTDSFETRPTVEELRNAAGRYLANNTPWVPNENIKINFIQLWQTEEFKDVAQLLRLKLCDRVDVYHPVLGITAENVEIIKVVYNVLQDRYDSMELGQAKSSLGSTIRDAATKEILKTVPTKSALQQAVDGATRLITGGLGGHLVIGIDGNGKPNELLLMDTDSISTAVNVLRINMNGIGFSSTGYNGPFTSAWTLDGHFIADFIDTGTLTANLIRAGILTDQTGNNYWNMATGEIQLQSYDSQVQARIDATANGLRAEVSNAYASKSEVSTVYEQTTESFEFTFNKLEEIDKYIRFEDGKIILGEADNPVTLVLKNDQIAFVSNLLDVAYFSDNKMYVTELEVSGSAIISGLSITRTNDGYLVDIKE